MAKRKRSTSRRVWTAGEFALVRRDYPDRPTADIAKALGRNAGQVYQAAQRLGLKKSPEYLASPNACRLRRGDKVGAAFRFGPGHVPANKGLRRPGYAAGRMSETWFKPGSRSVRWDPELYAVGALRLNADGYVDIKFREGLRAWKPFHRFLWECEHGPVPPGFCLIFCDGDHLNIGLDNLELITGAELMRRNTVHNLPKPIAETIQLLGALKRKINGNERKQQRAGGTAGNDRGSSERDLRDAARTARGHGDD